jgi:cytochrome c oxidase cbb3-type subunit 2
VRPLPQDKVFGRPSAPGDFAYQTPELLGSQRTGPDLTNIGARQPSEVWQYIHLYNPRAVVTESIMPSFDWMFEVVAQPPPGITAVPLPKAYAPARGVVVPKREAQALLAYLQSLKQPELPRGAADGASAGMAGAADTASAAGASTAGGAGAAAGAAGAAGAARAGSAAGGAGATTGAAAGAEGSGYDPAKGQALFTANCAACHQASGEGLSGAFPPLKGNAVVNDKDAAAHIHAVLHGVQGVTIDGVAYTSPMPPFAATLDDAAIASIINYERKSWGNHGASVTAQQVAAERAKAW